MTETPDLPQGSVTFLFSDIEGSTRHAQALGSETWAGVLAIHDELADSTITGHDGVVVKHEGDGVFAGFASAGSAAAAAVDFMRRIHAASWPGGAAVRVRIGLHTGEGRTSASGADYVGIDVHYAARIAAAGNGGQIVVSDSTRALVDGSLPVGTHLADDGLHRVKDFDEPRRLSRLVVPDAADDARPLRSIGARTNLPDDLSTFVGRVEEVAAVTDLLAAGRLVTITGPGGAGKTRLAIEVATRVADDHPDGAWLVDLAPISDPALVPSAIASALGIAEEVDRPIADTLRIALRDRRSLLLLDNFEQVVDAAPLVSALLREAREVRVLVSSREPLRIAGEREYRVPALRGSDAVTLFVERARSVRPEFALTDDTASVVAAICRRLDDLPLAIELAAARVRLFSPERLLERLSHSLDVLSAGSRDLPERQRTLRAAIAWSHDLLEPDEQELFRRLGVFAGGWTIDSAVDVCADEGTSGPPLEDRLLSLVDKSLVVEMPGEAGEPRFRQLVTVNEFALERLEASGERLGIAARHAAHMLALAETAEPVLEYGDPGQWLDRLELEAHNLRAALRWSIDSDELDIGLRLAASIWRFWQHRSHLREGLDWFDRLLERHPDEICDARFKALIGAGGLAYWLADYGRAGRDYEEAISLADALDDDRLRAEATFALGFIAMVDKRIDRLRELHGTSLALFEKVGDRRGVAKVRQGLILATILQRDWAAAYALSAQDVAFQREIGATFRTSEGETLLAASALGLGDLDDAHAHIAESIAIKRQLDLPVSMVGSLVVGALIANASGDYERGARIAGAAAAGRERLGSSNPAIEILHMPDPADGAREALGDEVFEGAYAAGRLLTLDEGADLALVVPGGPTGEAPTPGPATTARGSRS